MELKDNISYYDEFSAGYEKRRHYGYHRFLDDLQVDIVREFLRPGARLLEVGCGTGLLMSRLRDHEGDLLGVDPSPGMLAHARDRRLDVVQAGAESLPFEDASFDLVYSFKVLPHVEAIGKAMSECTRVLRTGGTALLEFYNPRSIRGLRKAIVTQRISPGGTAESQVFTRFDTASSARTHVRRAGLRFGGHRGAIILTPFAQIHGVPLLGPGLRALEGVASNSPLRVLAGFLTTIGHKG